MLCHLYRGSLRMRALSECHYLPCSLIRAAPTFRFFFDQHLVTNKHGLLVPVHYCLRLVKNITEDKMTTTAMGMTIRMFV